MVLSFFLLFITFMFVDINRNNVRFTILKIMYLSLALMAGFRSLKWNDTQNYWYAFSRHTHLLGDFSFSDTPFKYNEKGFLLLSSIIKTIYDSPRFYLVAISVLTMFVLYKVMRKYSVYPLIGLMIYVARFFVPRHFMQIRAALAIVIVIYAISYIQRRDWKRFFGFVFIATTLHTSALLAAPLYWLYKIRLTPRIVVYSLLAGFSVTFMYPDTVVNYVTQLSFNYDIATAYTAESGEYTIGKGLRNPVIYYQITLLLAFAHFVFKKKIMETGYNKILLWGYLYSTMILIIFSPFSILSGRTSTLFATLEVCIVPNLICLAKKNMRFVLCPIVICFYAALMYIGSLEWP